MLDKRIVTRYGRALIESCRRFVGLARLVVF